MCGLILRDEGGHIRFHCDRLAASGRDPTGIAGGLWAVQFWLCGYAAATMLWLNHGRCLARLGASRIEFYREVTLELMRFLKSLAKAACGGPSRTALAVRFSAESFGAAGVLRSVAPETAALEPIRLNK